MILPKAFPKYDAVNEQETREALQQADTKNVKKGDTIYLRRNELVVSAPDGSLWALKVDNAGVVTTEARS